jgi:oligopeptide/dipeptide ABC transporter ATP-binding protein
VSDTPVLEASDISVRFDTPGGELEAVDDVSLSVSAGRTLAIVGESGSGKTVFTRAALGLLDGDRVRVTGTSRLAGTDLLTLPKRQRSRIWGRRIGLVSQNPMVALNPVVRIGRQITETLTRNLGLRGAAADRRATELLDAVGIPDPQRRLREYPHQLSGGLRQRVTIAMAISCEPDLLVADEPTTALDVTVQAQILELLKRLQAEHGMGMIFVTHDLGVVAGLADEIAVMYAGRVVERASTKDLFKRPRMWYTEGLLAATPQIGSVDEVLRSIEGRPPNMLDPPAGCRFHPRCQRASEQCQTRRPELASAGDGHVYECWHPIEVAAEPAALLTPRTAPREDREIDCQPRLQERLA